MSRTVIGDTARDACEKFPQYSTREIARYLVEHEPLVFHSFDQARLAVQYYRGERGSKLKPARHSRVTTTKKKFKVPKSDAKPLSAFRLPVKKGIGTILSDIHVPYHDESAIETAVEHAIKRNATDFLILNGDALDAYQLSRYVKDPRQREFAGELEMANELLDSLQGVFGLVVFKLGNHEVRYYDYIFKHAPSLLGIPGTTWNDMLRLKERGIPLVEAEQEIGVAYSGGRQNLTIVHGHEFYQAGFAPVNAARGLFLRAKCCAIQGHLHQTSTHAEGRLDGTPVTTWGLGCLCDLRPQYAPMAFTKWNHGFALLELDGKEFRVSNHRILDGHVY